MRVEDLRIYQEAYRLAKEIHKISLGLPRFEMYEEGSQIRRSSKSVAAQIVEGYALRRYKNEYVHYLTRAYASNMETKAHLDLLFETSSLKDEVAYKKLEGDIVDLNRMLFAFIDSVEKGHRSQK